MPEHLQISSLAGIPAVFSHGLKLAANAQLVYCSGQIHARGPTNTLEMGSIAQKTTCIIENLEKVLQAGGSSLNQLVKVNIYITSFSFFAEMNETYAKLIPDPKPPRTCVQVAGLPFGADIEIEAIGWVAA